MRANLAGVVKEAMVKEAVVKEEVIKDTVVDTAADAAVEEAVDAAVEAAVDVVVDAAAVIKVATVTPKLSIVRWLARAFSCRSLGGGRAVGKEGGEVAMVTVRDTCVVPCCWGVSVKEPDTWTGMAFKAPRGVKAPGGIKARPPGGEVKWSDCDALWGLLPPSPELPRPRLVLTPIASLASASSASLKERWKEIGE